MKTFDVLLPPFNFRISTDIPSVVENLQSIYKQQLFAENTLPFIDYHLRVVFTNGLRKWVKPQARFFCDQHEPFKPLNESQAFAMLEWGMNWAIASYEMRHVIIHSGVLAKHNQAVLFPAPPGSGKSTMTAHLAFNGWQLFSDEMALIKPGTNIVTPFARPICLKNQSITLARKWFPEASFSSIAKDTHKGDVIHVAPPVSETTLFADAPIKAIIFPMYSADSDIDIVALDQAQAMHHLADNAFNFSVLGSKGFSTLCNVVEHAECLQIRYSDVNDVQEFLEQDILVHE